MSEMNSSNELMAEGDGIVELGVASEKTRGSLAITGLLDGGVNFPFVFYFG